MSFRRVVLLSAVALTLLTAPVLGAVRDAVPGDAVPPVAQAIGAGPEVLAFCPHCGVFNTTLLSLLTAVVGAAGGHVTYVPHYTMPVDQPLEASFQQARDAITARGVGYVVAFDGVLGRLPAQFPSVNFTSFNSWDIGPAPANVERFYTKTETLFFAFGAALVTLSRTSRVCVPAWAQAGLGTTRYNLALINGAYRACSNCSLYFIQGSGVEADRPAFEAATIDSMRARRCDVAVTVDSIPLVMKANLSTVDPTGQLVAQAGALASRGMDPTATSLAGAPLIVAGLASYGVITSFVAASMRRGIDRTFRSGDSFVDYTLPGMLNVSVTPGAPAAFVAELGRLFDAVRTEVTFDVGITAEHAARDRTGVATTAAFVPEPFAYRGREKLAFYLENYPDVAATQIRVVALSISYSITLTPTNCSFVELYDNRAYFADLLDALPDPATGAVPAPRLDAAVTKRDFRNGTLRMFLLAGWDAARGAALADVWMLEMNVAVPGIVRWHNLFTPPDTSYLPVDDAYPMGRHGAGAVAWGSRVLLLGGHIGTVVPLAEPWFFDLTSRKWRRAPDFARLHPRAFPHVGLLTGPVAVDRTTSAYATYTADIVNSAADPGNRAARAAAASTAQAVEATAAADCATLSGAAEVTVGGVTDRAFAAVALGDATPKQRGSQPAPPIQLYAFCRERAVNIEQPSTDHIAVTEALTAATLRNATAGSDALWLRSQSISWNSTDACTVADERYLWVLGHVVHADAADSDVAARLLTVCKWTLTEQRWRCLLRPPLPDPVWGCRKAYALDAKVALAVTVGERLSSFSTLLVVDPEPVCDAARHLVLDELRSACVPCPDRTYAVRDELRLVAGGIQTLDGRCVACDAPMLPQWQAPHDERCESSDWAFAVISAAVLLVVLVVGALLALLALRTERNVRRATTYEELVEAVAEAVASGTHSEVRSLQLRCSAHGGSLHRSLASFLIVYQQYLSFMPHWVFRADRPELAPLLGSSTARAVVPAVFNGDPLALSLRRYTTSAQHQTVAAATAGDKVSSGSSTAQPSRRASGASLLDDAVLREHRRASYVHGKGDDRDGPPVARRPSAPRSAHSSTGKDHSSHTGSGSNGGSRDPTPQGTPSLVPSGSPPPEPMTALPPPLVAMEDTQPMVALLPPEDDPPEEQGPALRVVVRSPSASASRRPESVAPESVVASSTTDSSVAEFRSADAIAAARRRFLHRRTLRPNYFVRGDCTVVAVRIIPLRPDGASPEQHHVLRLNKFCAALHVVARAHHAHVEGFLGDRASIVFNGLCHDFNHRQAAASAACTITEMNVGKSAFRTVAGVAGGPCFIGALSAGFGQRSAVMGPPMSSASALAACSDTAPRVKVFFDWALSPDLSKNYVLKLLGTRTPAGPTAHRRSVVSFDVPGVLNTSVGSVNPTVGPRQLLVGEVCGPRKYFQQAHMHRHSVELPTQDTTSSDRLNATLSSGPSTMATRQNSLRMGSSAGESSGSSLGRSPRKPVSPHGARVPPPLLPLQRPAPSPTAADDGAVRSIMRHRRPPQSPTARLGGSGESGGSDAGDAADTSDDATFTRDASFDPPIARAVSAGREGQGVSSVTDDATALREIQALTAWSAATEAYEAREQLMLRQHHAAPGAGTPPPELRPQAFAGRDVALRNDLLQVVASGDAAQRTALLERYTMLEGRPLDRELAAVLRAGELPELGPLGKRKLFADEATASASTLPTLPGGAAAPTTTARRARSAEPSHPLAVPALGASGVGSHPSGSVSFSLPDESGPSAPAEVATPATDYLPSTGRGPLVAAPPGLAHRTSPQLRPFRSPQGSPSASLRLSLRSSPAASVRSSGHRSDDVVGSPAVLAHSSSAPLGFPGRSPRPASPTVVHAGDSVSSLRPGSPMLVPE